MAVCATHVLVNVHDGVRGGRGFVVRGEHCGDVHDDGVRVRHDRACTALLAVRASQTNPTPT